MALRTALHGHLWTLVPHLGDAIARPTAPGLSWGTDLEDARFGSVRLGGRLHVVPGSHSIVIIVHGMGGHADKHYVARAARVAHAHGLSSLRLTLRGSDQSGEDIYHAGLVEDLQAAVRSPELESFQSIHVLGFSLGGHMTLRYALDPDPRVRSVAAICAPLNLAASCAHIDKPAQSVYRHHLLQGLRANARPVESRRALRLSKTPIERIRSVREWDEKVIAPRFGFAGADVYYQEISVSSRIQELAVPSLLVWAQADPMVHVRDLMPHLSALNRHTTVRWLPGGHVRFPGKKRVLDDAMRWLQRHA